MDRRMIAMSRRLLGNYRRLTMMVFNERVVGAEVRGAIVDKDGDLAPEDTIDLVYTLYGEQEGVDEAATALLQQVVDAGAEGQVQRGPLATLENSITVTIERVLNPNTTPS